MRAYQTIRFSETPDRGDIRSEARQTRIGNCSHHSAFHNPRIKRAIRRTLKRIDRARMQREIQEELG